MQVVELAKQTRGNTVSGTIVMGNGTLETLAGRRNVPAVVAAMLQRGAGNLSRKEIADRLEELKATLRMQGNFNQLTVNFQTQRDKLPELLGLIAEVLQHPTFSEAELEQLKSQMLAGIDMQRHEPQAVAQNALSRYDNPYPKTDIRYIPSFDEEVEIAKAMTVADLKAFHDDFYGADHAQLALVGDFDPAVIEPVLGKLFGLEGQNSFRACTRALSPISRYRSAIRNSGQGKRSLFRQARPAGESGRSRYRAADPGQLHSWLAAGSKAGSSIACARRMASAMERDPG